MVRLTDLRARLAAEGHDTQLAVDDFELGA
jgi:hypothetical protein